MTLQSDIHQNTWVRVKTAHPPFADNTTHIMREPNYTRKARMNSSYFGIILSATENAESTLTNVVYTIFFTCVIAALLWWLDRTSKNERNKTKRKRR